MAAPTLVSTTLSTNYANESALPKSTPSVSWLAGDLISVRGVTGDNTQLLTNPPTATGLTFTIVGTYPTNISSRMKHYWWTATAGSSGSSVITSNISPSTGGGGICVRVWRAHGGTGAVMTHGSGTTGAPNGTITTTAPNSAIELGWSSWNRSTGTRTYITAAGSPTEDAYLDTATYGTSGEAYYADAGAAGAESVGITAPTANAWLCVAGEILAPVQEFLPDADTVTTGWTSTPLYSKLNDGSDATVVTATLA